MIEIGTCKPQELATVLIAMRAFRFRVLQIYLEPDNSLTFIYG